MKNTRLLKIFIALALIVSFIIPLSNIEASAASPQIGTIDITSGKLNVRNAPSKNAKVIGTLKRSDKVKSLGQSKTGWTTIQYGKGKGYISSDHVRFYKTTSLNSVKKANERILAIENKALSKPQTKQQFYKSMSPAFTKGYLDMYFKTEMWPAGKDSKGNQLYRLKDTDSLTFAFVEFDWYLQYETSKPEYSFYTKKGTEYMVISQFFQDNEINYAHWKYFYLVKEPKSNWKAYDIQYNVIYDD